MKQICFNKRNFSKCQNSSGFTLVELLMATFILVPIYIMTILGFINSARINELSRSATLALSSSLNQMDDIQNTAFDQIYLTYNNATFTPINPDELDGIGTTHVNNTQPNYVTITTHFCWVEPNGRIMGEDLNGNGYLDLSEDTNGNGELDSPVRLVLVIYDVS